MSRPRFLAISGSLRAASSNTAVLARLAQLAPALGTEVELYPRLAEIPLFNPDRENESIAVVDDWRARIRSARALVFCAPEYAHGIPGALKNALDWLVGGIEIVDKPVSVLNLSPHSQHADAALREVLKTMSARIVPAASVTLALPGKKSEGFGTLAADDALTARLQDVLRHLRDAAG